MLLSGSVLALFDIRFAERITLGQGKVRLKALPPISEDVVSIRGK